MKIREKILQYMLCFLTAAFLLIGCADAKVPANETSGEAAIGQLPSGDVWLYHVKHDLLPFWTQPAALGQPLGNFPTYRDNDGKLYSQTNPAVRDIDKEYVRMKSRQIYAYCVGYHLTGDEKLLAYARAGVDYLRKSALFAAADGKKGVYSYFSQSTNAWGPTEAEINSQDLSYALNGLAMYYYLTRDAEILDDIVAVKDYIFTHYYDPNTHLLSWYPQNGKAHGKELVATLDQINAYMLCLTPILPTEYKHRPLRQQWQSDLENMAYAIIKEYYSPENNLFWGTDNKVMGTRHVDYGHSIKTFWMLYQIGQQTGKDELRVFAKGHAPLLLERAYCKDNGSWASRPGDASKEWWIYAELDQMAATLGLSGAATVKYLPNTYKFWLTYIVDKSSKEVWSWVAPDGTLGKYSGKQGEWKNAFHSFEHALVSYITTQQMKKENVTLYFAFKDKPEDITIRPYLYSGEIENIEQQGNQYTVTFSGIR